MHFQEPLREFAAKFSNENQRRPDNPDSYPTITNWLENNCVKMSEKPDNPYDMNSPSFDADKYLQKLLKVSAHR